MSEEETNGTTDVAASAELVVKRLTKTKLCEIVETSPGADGFGLLLRVKKVDESDFLMKVVFPLLEAAEGNFEMFAGRQYMLKDGQRRQAFLLHFSGSDLAALANTVATTLREQFPPANVMEVKVLGGRVPNSGGLATGRKGVAVTPGAIG